MIKPAAYSRICIAIFTIILIASSCKSITGANKPRSGRDIAAWQLELKLRSHGLFRGWELANGFGGYDVGAIYLRHKTTTARGYFITSDAIVYLCEPRSILDVLVGSSIPDYPGGEIVGDIDGYNVGIAWANNKKWPKLRQCVDEVLKEWTENEIH